MNFEEKYIKYKIKYIKYKTQVNENTYNKITKTIINYNNNDIIVYDDSYLIGGTKTRLLNLLLPKLKEKEIIYAGPSTGLAQVALAFVSKKYNKRATIFLSSYDKNNSQLVDLAIKHGAKIIYPKIQSLKYVRKIAEKYALKKKYRYLLPFGLKSDNNLKLFRTALNIVLQNEEQPKRLWLVAGSGFLLEVLHSIWPDTKYMIVQVGKKIWPDQLENINNELFIAPENFTENASSQPPYNTIPWYDAKLWQFFEKYGKKNDCIWNVGGL